MIPPTLHERLRREHGYRSVFALAFSPDGSLLASAGDEDLQLWAIG